MRITHFRKHGYNSWTEFLSAFPDFEDVEWKEHSKKASKSFWANVTKEKLAERKTKALKTWYSASEEEQKSRTKRRSLNVKNVWKNMSSEEYSKRCKNIGLGFIEATSSEQRSNIGKLAASYLPQDQNKRCSEGMKKYWASLSPDEYQNLCEKRSLFWSSMPEHEYKERCQKFKIKWENRPEDERERLKDIYRSNVRKSFGTIESSIERFCRRDLEDLGYEVEKQFSSLFIDLFVPSLNLAVELYGSFWHCDPRYFKMDYMHPLRNLTSKEIWTKDCVKQQKILKSHNLLILWEDDYTIKVLKTGIEHVLANPTGHSLWMSLTPGMQSLESAEHLQ